MMLLVLMVLFLTQDMGFAMKKKNMMMMMLNVDHNDGGTKLTSMETDQEFESNNHHWIPRGSWQSGQSQSGQSTSDDTHA